MTTVLTVLAYLYIAGMSLIALWAIVVGLNRKLRRERRDRLLTAAIETAAKDGAERLKREGRVYHLPSERKKRERRS